MHRRIIVPGALGAASLMLASPATAAAHSPGAPGIGDPYIEARRALGETHRGPAHLRALHPGAFCEAT